VTPRLLQLLQKYRRDQNACISLGEAGRQWRISSYGTQRRQLHHQGKPIFMTDRQDTSGKQAARNSGKHGGNRPFAKPTMHKRRRPQGAPGASANSVDNYIYGLHAAEFALKNEARRIEAIWATENAERKLTEVIGARNISVERVSPRDLDKRVGPDAVHQGIVLHVSPLDVATLDDITEKAYSSGLPIILLDQVTDPHNVGAVLRSGAVFGAAGLIMTQRHSPPLGGVLAKAASGALELMPVCLVQNLAKAIAEMKRQSFPVIGLDGTEDHRLLEDGLADLGGKPAVLALGAEGKGLRELTRESCDELCRIGGDGPIASLNVSNAAAIALHLGAMGRRRG
jgi:23S rRNA (guanosine2251-2'-O)-methyltransferase